MLGVSPRRFKKDAERQAMRLPLPGSIGLRLAAVAFVSGHHARTGALPLVRRFAGGPGQPSTAFSEVAKPRDCDQGIAGETGRSGPETGSNARILWSDNLQPFKPKVQGRIPAPSPP